MVKSLSEVFPLFSIEQDTLVSSHGDLTIGFEVILPELFSLSESDYEAFHQSWIKAIKLLPSNCIFHKQDWFTESAFQCDFTKEKSFLSQKSDHYFFERPFLSHRCLVYITLKPSDRKLSSSALCNLIRPSIVPKQLIQEKNFHELKDAAGQFAAILKDSTLTELRLLKDLDYSGSPEKAGLIEQYCFLLDHPEPVLKDIVLKEALQIGNAPLHVYSLSDPKVLPAFCGPRINYDRYSTDKTKFSVGFVSPVGLLLNCNHIYNQYIFLEDPHKTIHRLEKKRLKLQSLSAYSRENAISKEAVQAFLNEALSESRQPVKAHFNLMAWSEHPMRQEEIKNKLTTAIAQLEAVPKKESDGAPQLFFAGIPGNEADFPMNDCFDSFLETACCFLNLESNAKSSVAPVGIRLGERYSGRPLQVDLSDEPMKKGIITNRNKFILGPSGSGKSFFTNHMLRSYYEQNSHIVIVDVGHSYKGLNQLVGGYYFTYDQEHPLAFNPFYLEGGDHPDTEKKESIKTLLLALWKKETENFYRSEYVALSNALQSYYEKLFKHPDIFPCIDSFYEFLQTDYKELIQTQRVKEKDFDLSNFLYVLRPFYKGGEFAYLLNARKNLDLLQQRFIVFELDTIKDHPILFPVVTIIIMEVFISKMRKLKGERKIILIEEAWKAIAREGMAEYIKYLFKTVRKFYGEAIVVTQEVEDILSSPIVKQAILNNADCKILLDQSKYQNKFDQVQQLLALTEKEKAMVLSLNKANDPRYKYKEVFISLGGMASRVYRTEVSIEEYLAYTTEETEKLELEKRTRATGDMTMAIQQLAQEKRIQKMME